MNYFSSSLVSLILLLATTSAFAECNLMPKDIPWDSRKFIRKFNKNAEKEITSYFKEEHAAVMHSHKLLKKTKKDIKSNRKQLEKVFESFEKGNISLQTMIDEKTNLIYKLELLEVFQGFLQRGIDEIYETLPINMQSDQIIISPNGIRFDLTTELFFRPRPNTKIIIPIGRGFLSLDESSIIYLCWNISLTDKSKNVISLRFLKANKKIPDSFNGYVERPYTLLTQIASYFQPPRVKIDPGNYFFRRRSDLDLDLDKDSDETATVLLEGKGLLGRLGRALKRVGNSVDMALEDPLKDLVGKGASSLIIKGDQMCIQTGIKTAFALIKIKHIGTKCFPFVNQETGEPLIDSFTNTNHDYLDKGDNFNEGSIAVNYEE